MKDLAKRFAQNPLLSPASMHASREAMEIASLLNPGVFRFENKIWLIIRVAERPVQNKDEISFPVLKEDGKTKINSIKKNDPGLRAIDARVINYKGEDFLTTLSHFRLLCSDNGINFYEPDNYPRLCGETALESFGIEDCRVSFIENKYWLTYTAVSSNGVGVGLRTTADWKTFQSYGMIIPPHNKDCALFEEKINSMFYCFHRPSSPALGGNYIWLARSTDGIHWGDHKCIMKTRPGLWDSARIGAGAAPIKTSRGWLEIYHGADEKHRYCLGAVLLDMNDPSKIIARTKEPIMSPSASYELNGFFGNVVFTNGHIIDPDGDTLTIYYGAADEFVCGATFSLKEIMVALECE